MPLSSIAENVGFIALALPAFLLLLTLIVFIHEFGHFSMARLCGVRVEVFSIGFGKPFARWRDRHGTEWRLAWIPLGGYVKFFGDANAASTPDPEHVDSGPATTQFTRPDDAGRGLSPEERKVSFHFKPVWQRAWIVAAGPFSNFALAVGIFWALFFWLGVVSAPAIVGAVTPGSAAEAAGIAPGDRIVSVNGAPIREFSDLANFIRLSSGDRLRIVVEREGEAVTLVATPKREEIEDALGNKVQAGVLGVSGQSGVAKFEKLSAVAALQKAVDEVWSVIAGTTRFFGRLLSGREDLSQLGGPIKMMKYAGQAASVGFREETFENAAEPDFFTRLKVSLSLYFNLAALVSVSIGFLNLLPIPVLDGGHLMYYAIEAAVGKPLGAKAQAIGFRIGMILLLAFMLFVTWNDLVSFSS